MNAASGPNAESVAKDMFIIMQGTGPRPTVGAFVAGISSFGTEHARCLTGCATMSPSRRDSSDS
jgi:hypothetical protein